MGKCGAVGAGAGATRSKDDDYSLGRAAILKQDLYQAIFEHSLGMYPPAARASVLLFSDKTEIEWRDHIKRLQYVLTTVALETLEEGEVVRILEEPVSSLEVSTTNHEGPSDEEVD